ncbi:MAG: RNA chaperone Hfq [Acidobacteriota bacterium]
MQKQPPNVQDSFLNHARRERMNVTIYLMSGAKLTGRIKNFDRFAIIMDNNGVDQMVFKHAISTISGTRQFGNYMNLDTVVGSAEKKD